jgi:hypothetical protein
LQLRQQAQRQVGAARGHVLAQTVAGHGHHVQRDAWGCLGQRIHQHGQEIHLAHIGHGQGETPRAVGRVKRGTHLQRLLQAVERCGHRFGQLQGIGRGHHAALGAQKQVVVQTGPQTAQGTADGGLAHAQNRGHVGHTLFPQQVVKHQQQVQIEAGKFHGGLYLKFE